MALKLFLDKLVSHLKHFCCNRHNIEKHPKQFLVRSNQKKQKPNLCFTTSLFIRPNPTKWVKVGLSVDYKCLLLLLDD